MARQRAFGIRPRPDSALARIAEQKRSQGEGMTETIHQWAEKAERLAEQSQGREERE